VKVVRKKVTPQQFVASIGFDRRLAPYDLEASIAHVEMLARRRIVAPKEGKRLAAGLRRILARVKAGGRLLPAEDVHYALEKTLFRAVGPLAGKMHTARSRNDQTVTALRLYLREQIDVLSEGLRDLAAAFLLQAEANASAVMPGYTHLQPGQPVLLAHHLLAYAWMFQRDRERLAGVRRRTNVLPLGAAALAGTAFPIDRAWVAKRLGFDGVIENSIDAVSDRDFLVDFLSAASLAMAHLSRFCEEVVVWSNPSFGFVTVADDFATGSSIMPQKRNPDVAEIVRGKAGRVFGSLAALLALLKSQPLAYNRDLQEDKPPVFDAVDTLKACLDVTAPMVRSLAFRSDKMRDACGLGYLLATDMADALARRGLPFRQAHGVTAAVVKYAQDHGLPLEDVPLTVLKTYSPLFGPWIHQVLSVDKAVAARASRGGTAPSSVRRQLAGLKRLLRAGA
jgi:argininosuccinate lyase